LRKLYRGIVAAVVVCLSLVVTASGADPKERFSAIIDEEGGMPTRLTISVHSWTTDQEAQAFGAAFKSGGNNALRTAMIKASAGYVSVTGSMGWPLNFARSIPNGTGQTIVVAADRPLGMGNVASGSATTEFPFGVIVLNIGANGKGTGQLIQQAKLEIDATGKLNVNAYSGMGVELMGVRKQK